jgi:hypothetical protein
MSGLPFYDVMLMENLPKSASLPVSTVQETKRRITSGIWDFDYMFFTESDQVKFQSPLSPSKFNIVYAVDLDDENTGVII